MRAPALHGRAERGRRAEELAAECLERVGMRILARNWRRPEGELDLIAIDRDGTCVFCEVRSRQGEASGEPIEAVNRKKQVRVIRAARLFLAAEGTVAATGYRFDVVAVTFWPDGRSPRVVHVPAAFETTG